MKIVQERPSFLQRAKTIPTNARGIDFDFTLLRQQFLSNFKRIAPSTINNIFIRVFYDFYATKNTRTHRQNLTSCYCYYVIINGKSQTLLSDFFEDRGGCTQASAPPPGTKHLAVVKKNFHFHAPILWIKQSLIALNVVIKT